MAKQTLREGMRAGDLADLVLPLISVDEYESQIDPKKAIVFGFYVHDRDAANDLNRFIQKSAVPLLDTEVSPAPDQHGYYLVFVEFYDNERMPAEFQTLLNEIEPLVDVDDWTIRVRRADEPVGFSVEALTKALAHAKAETPVSEAAILKFLQPSDLLDVRVNGHDLVMETAQGAMHFTVKGLRDISTLLTNLNLMETAVSPSLKDALYGSRLANALGSGWSANVLGETILIGSPEDDFVLAVNLK